MPVTQSWPDKFAQIQTDLKAKDVWTEPNLT